MRIYIYTHTYVCASSFVNYTMYTRTFSRFTYIARYTRNYIYTPIYIYAHTYVCASSFVNYTIFVRTFSRLHTSLVTCIITCIHRFIHTHTRMFVRLRL